MSNKIKDINIKNRTFYLFNDIVDIENLHWNDIKIDEKPYRNFLFTILDMSQSKNT